MAQLDISIWSSPKNPNIHHYQSASRNNISCSLFYPDLHGPLYLLLPIRADSSLSFRPPLCIPAQVYKTHWQQNMYRLSLSSPTSVSLFLWSIGSVFPITQPLPFLPPPIWSPTLSRHLSEEVYEGRGHPSSLPPLLLNWLLVASVDTCRHLSPLLWRASEQTSCSFVAFLSFQPQACLPKGSRRGDYKLCQGHCSHLTNLPASTHTHAILFNLLWRSSNY